MHFVSWNVNGLRAALKKGFMESFKQLDADAFCQTRMDAGHGGLVLAAWCLALPTRPESRPVLLSFSHSNRAMSWQ